MSIKTKLLLKKIVTFLLCSPAIIKHAKDIWDMLKEIYNQETWNELNEIKEKSIENEVKE